MSSRRPGAQKVANGVEKESTPLALFVTLQLSGPLRLRVQSWSRTRLRIAGLYRVFVSRLFYKGLRHYRATIARLSFLSGLEQGGRGLLHAF